VMILLSAPNAGTARTRGTVSNMTATRDLRIQLLLAFTSDVNRA
jgi:hypothetical protein